MAVAAYEERYEDAARLRDQIESALAKDRKAAVCVAMESALNDKRYDEAAILRNTFINLGDSEAYTSSEEQNRSGEGI